MIKTITSLEIPMSIKYPIFEHSALIQWVLSHTVILGNEIFDIIAN